MKYRLSQCDSQHFLRLSLSAQKHLEHESYYYTPSSRYVVSEDSESIACKRVIEVSFRIFAAGHTMQGPSLTDEGDIIFLSMHEFILKSPIQPLG